MCPLSLSLSLTHTLTHLHLYNLENPQQLSIGIPTEDYSNAMILLSWPPYNLNIIYGSHVFVAFHWFAVGDVCVCMCCLFVFVVVVTFWKVVLHLCTVCISIYPTYWMGTYCLALWLWFCWTFLSAVRLFCFIWAFISLFNSVSYV